jgi:hypothetical protein
MTMDVQPKRVKGGGLLAAALLLAALASCLAILPASAAAAPYATPTVTITGDNGHWRPDPARLTVTATVDPSLSITAFQYSLDGGVTWIDDVPGTGNVRTLIVSQEGVIHAAVKVTDSASQTATASVTVRIDWSGPHVQLSRHRFVFTASQSAALHIKMRWTDRCSRRCQLHFVAIQHHKSKYTFPTQKFTLRKRGQWQTVKLVWGNRVGRMTLRLVLTDTNHNIGMVEASIVATRL